MIAFTLPQPTPTWYLLLAAVLFGRVVLLTAAFDPAVELRFGQELVQLLIEGMTRRLRQTVANDEQRFLPLPPLAHRHRARLHAKRGRSQAG